VTFRGPYADGPPADELDAHVEPLEPFGLTELRRMVTVLTVLVVSIAAGALQRVLRPRGRSLLECASGGLIEGFFRLGPTFVKLGQVIASSPGLFPEAMSRPAQRCLQEVPPFPSSTVRQVVEEDLGVPIDVAFRSFDDTPLSAASVGQVHACVLPDGREAVVKVQRPDIRGRMMTDLRINYRVARLLMHTKIGRRANAVGQIRDLHKVTSHELHPPLEAHRQDRFRQKLGFFGDNTRVTVPEIFWTHCGPRVICMERVYGVPMDRFDELERIGFDARNQLRRGMKAWLEALVVHGPFHGDLHAGNIWALRDGRSCFLDFGIMGELDQEWRGMVRDILYTFMVDGDFTRIIAGYKRLGVISDSVGDDEQLAAIMSAVFGPMMAMRMQDLNFGEMFQQSLDMAEQMGDISAPEELSLLGKQFLYFERYVKGIAPDYTIVSDPYLIKNIFPDEARQKMAELRTTADPSAVIDPDEDAVGAR
jgi:predicted unusual protein kinase regulating ubiquinone biosynthesis (AarF/ABC1/UbiB family)